MFSENLKASMRQLLHNHNLLALTKRGKKKRKKNYYQFLVMCAGSQCCVEMIS
uniref:Uncharacterized protein n=1 Tax=Rhizophora mucronata TaxID=61149 RepID=A0A2P2PJW0_RHIMU